MNFKNKHSALLIFIMITVIQIDSFGQSCNNLRQKNESYGQGDGESWSWCDVEPSTPYTQCMCEKERDYASVQNERQKVIKEFNEAANHVQKLRKEARSLSSSGNHDAAISMLQSRVMPLAYNIPTGGLDTYEASRKREIEYTEGEIESIEAEKEQQEMEDNEKTITLSGSGSSGSYNNAEEDDSSNDYEYSGSQYSGYSSSNNTESIYQKKQREAAEKANAKAKYYAQQQKQADAQVARSRQQEANMDRASQTFENNMRQMTDSYSRQIAAQSAAKKERYARALAERREDERLEQIRINRRRAEREEREREQREEQRVTEAQKYFLNGISDENTPIISSINKVFVILITRNYTNNSIQLSPFTLSTNSDHKLPYKIEVVNDYKLKNSKSDVSLQGPFNTLAEQQNAIEKIRNNARNNYIKSSILTYSYKSVYANTQKNTTTVGADNTNFWGDKPETTATKPKPKTTTSDTDFWGEEKKSKNKPKPKKSIWD